MADFVEGEDMTLKKNHPAGYNGITDGVIWQQLLLFFFPILFGTFFQQLYNTADAMIVGKFVGKVPVYRNGQFGAFFNDFYRFCRDNPANFTVVHILLIK